MPRLSPAAKLARIHTVVAAWRAHARSVSFFGMTLTQFIAEVQASLDAREEIADLQRRTRLAIRRRDTADDHSFELISGVGFAVKGNPAYGEDSALYGSMGFRREVDRRANIRRGWRRRRKAQLAR